MIGFIRGVKYVIRRAPLRKNRGDCDSPRTKNPQIRISNKLKDMEELEVLLHEYLHGALWDLSEDTVHDVAVDGAKIIWDWGYRKTEKEA